MIPMVERMRLRPPIQFFQPLSHINSVLFASIAMLTVRLVDSQEGQQAASQVHGRPRRIRVIPPHGCSSQLAGTALPERRDALCHRMRVRRECLDFLIPLTERHLRRLLGEWVRHYNGGRPHRSLGPGIPDQGRGPTIMTGGNRHRIAEASQLSARSVLGGLHHEYAWDRSAA